MFAIKAVITSYYALFLATYQKAEVLYQMGRFEEALVFYHMGGKQRPDMELFQQGVRKAQEAIEVSLGGNFHNCYIVRHRDKSL